MDEWGVSENLGTILAIGILAAAAVIVTVMVTGIADGGMGLENPKFAMFEAGTIMGYDRFEPHAMNIPVIKICETGGDELDIRYTEGSHSGLLGTKLYLFDPEGNSREITQSVTMTGDSIDAGEDFYIFYYVTGEAGKSNVWITNDIARINGGWPSGVQRFSPSGTWRILIVDDDNRGTIIVDKNLDL